VASGLSVGLLVYELWLGDALPALILRNQAYPESRTTGTWIVLGSLLLAGASLVPMLRRHVDAEGSRPWLKVLSLAFLVPPLLSHEIWHAAPLLCSAMGLVAVTLAAHWMVAPEWPSESEPERVPAWVLACLALLVLSYTAFVSAETIRQHELLETRAYDMGIMENVLWHTSQGRPFESSLEGKNHLGVHTSFIYLLLAPLYRLFPQTSTLLICQAFVIAIAAVPLFLLSRFLLRSSSAALLIASLFLLHPAVQGANFYDFHELAFAPVLFLAALYGLLRDRPVLMWGSVALLLSVKEDCAILVFALGIVALLERRFRVGAAFTVIGLVAYVVLQMIVIRHFAGGESSFTWYYSDMVPSGEGPVGLLRTVLLNPLYSLSFALTAPKALYVLQTLGSVLLLCLFGWRGLALVAYGLAMSLLASREYLFELGFQYSLLLIPAAFAGGVIELSRTASQARLRLSGSSWRKAFVAMAGVSLLFAYHEGMFAPGARFKSGFRVVDFRWDDERRDRFREVRDAAALIPEAASVTASETLVPHVSKRLRVQTLRYAADGLGRDYDYFFILKTDLDPQTGARYRSVLDGRLYELVKEGRTTLLLRKRT
jgi:uncharacterized membrane protein